MCFVFHCFGIASHLCSCWKLVIWFYLRPEILPEQVYFSNTRGIRISKWYTDSRLGRPRNIFLFHLCAKAHTSTGIGMPCMLAKDPSHPATMCHTSYYLKVTTSRHGSRVMLLAG